MNLDVAVADFIAALAAERGLSANTTAAYRRDLDQYVTHCSEAGVLTVEDVTPDLVSGFAGNCRQEVYLWDSIMGTALVSHVPGMAATPSPPCVTLLIVAPAIVR